MLMIRMLVVMVAVTAGPGPSNGNHHPSSISCVSRQSCTLHSQSPPDPSFDDYVPFGGWTAPSAKQVCTRCRPFVLVTRALSGGGGGDGAVMSMPLTRTLAASTIATVCTAVRQHQRPVRRGRRQQLDALDTQRDPPRQCITKRNSQEVLLDAMDPSAASCSTRSRRRD